MGNLIHENIFRAYDIRGIYQEELTENVALKLGRAVSTLLNGESKGVIVGRDFRLSGEQLKNALMRGLGLGGCDVEDIGIVTTPALYFSSAHYGKAAGVMVTLITRGSPPDVTHPPSISPAMPIAAIRFTLPPQMPSKAGVLLRTFSTCQLISC